MSCSVDEVPNGGSSIVGSTAYTARLTVQRNGGTYGRVIVTWSVNGTSNADADITPSSGQVVFAEDETLAMIEITTVDDQVNYVMCVFAATVCITESNSFCKHLQYMYVCMYVCMYICLYVHVCTYVCTYCYVLACNHS